MTDKQSWTIALEHDEETGELVLPLPEGMMESQGWKHGDTIEWIDNKDGSWTMKKKEESQWVLVEAVQLFRTRYMVQVPAGADKVDWALDVVTMENAQEFSQKSLDETIISHRVVTKEEALSICDEDNGYAKNWDTKLKVKVFFTKEKDYE
jgi:hypothetical protein